MSFGKPMEHLKRIMDAHVQEGQMSKQIAANAMKKIGPAYVEIMDKYGLTEKPVAVANTATWILATITGYHHAGRVHAEGVRSLEGTGTSTEAYNKALAGVRNSYRTHFLGAYTSPKILTAIQVAPAHQADFAREFSERVLGPVMDDRYWNSRANTMRQARKASGPIRPRRS